MTIQLNNGTTITADPIQEFKRCKQDPIYFIDNYCYIVDSVKGVLPFRLFDYQKRVIGCYQNKQFNIIKKPRQMGLSWLTACYGLWLINFHNDKTVLVVSIGDSHAKEFKDKARYNFDLLPGFLQVDAIDKTKHGLNLSNGSQFQSIPQTREAGRSKSLSLLILDEIAFQEYADNIWAAAWPTLSTGGNAVLISTTNGMGNLYHRVYEDATNEVNDFNSIDICWKEYPGRDDKWLAQQRRQLGKRRFRSEIMCEFVGSGDTVISGELLKKLAANVTEPLIKYKLPMSDKLAKSLLKDEYHTMPGLWIWDLPAPAEKYILSADVATGNEQDASAFQLIRLRDNKQVCEYKNKSVRVHDYANIIKIVARYYNNAYVIIESNSWGLATFEKLYRDQLDPYLNLYLTKKRRASWETTAKTRPKIINTLMADIDNEVYQLVSSRLLSELQTFIWKGNRAQALRSYTDDLVISLAILMFIRPMLSAFVPASLTSSNEDEFAFKFDDESIKEYHQQQVIRSDENNPWIEEEGESAYDDSGYMTEKAMVRWLGK